MNRRALGLTFVEIVVVTAILMVLATVAWLALGPSLKANAVETRIRSDLKQIVSAIHIYMADYDGKLPRNFDVLPPSVPRKIPELPRHGSIGSTFGGNRYFYTQPYHMQIFSEHFAKYPWDPARDPIVKAFMRFRVTGNKHAFIDFDHTGAEKLREEKETLVLGALLDGSIHWFPARQVFEREFASQYWRLGRLR